jgi:hypothetical protein
MSMKSYTMFGAIILLVTLNTVQFLTVKRLRSETTYSEADLNIINRAATLYGKIHGASPEQVMKGRFPVVMYIGDARCVSLQVRQGGAGQSPVYCFGSDDKQKTTIDTNSPSSIYTR